MLVNSGRHIDAVNLSFAFELTEQFSPVLLLKSYLTERRHYSNSATIQVFFPFYILLYHFPSASRWQFLETKTLIIFHVRMMQLKKNCLL